MSFICSVKDALLPSATLKGKSSPTHAPVGMRVQTVTKGGTRTEFRRGPHDEWHQCAGENRLTFKCYF